MIRAALVGIACTASSLAGANCGDKVDSLEGQARLDAYERCIQDERDAPRRDTEDRARAAAVTAAKREHRPETMKWWEACEAWGRAYRSKNDREGKLRAYLIGQGFLTDIDRAHTGDRSIAIGMSECGVFASLGTPNAANSTETAHGRSTQYVYRSSGRYVYVEPSSGPLGVVRTIQY